VIDGLAIGGVALAGLALGGFFFAGLWWTVRRALPSPRAALWFALSMVVRTAVVVTGFFFLCGDDWRKWAAGLCGFVVARVAVLRVTRAAAPAARTPGGARHAP
jgi:F1F0 ATPase subunit 2